MKLKNGNFNFWCTNELCNARVIVSNNSDQIVDQSKSSFLNPPTTVFNTI